MKNTKFIFTLLFLVYSVTAFSQISNTPVRFTTGDDYNPSFRVNNSDYVDILGASQWEFLIFERHSGSTKNILVSKIGENGAIDYGYNLTNNQYQNINPSIAYHIPNGSIRNALAVWETNMNGNQDVYGAIYKQSTGAWSSSFVIDQSAGDQTNPKAMLIDSTRYAVTYSSQGDIILRFYNINTNSIYLDSNLTTSISQNCTNPHVFVLKHIYPLSHVIFITYEREFSSNQKSIYALKGDLLQPSLSFMIDTVRLTGVNNNAGFSTGGSIFSRPLFVYENSSTGKINIYGTEIKWTAQPSINHTVVTSNTNDVYSYCGSQFILGDATTHDLYGYISRGTSNIDAIIKVLSTQVSVQISNNSSYVSKTTCSSSNPIQYTGCYRIWITYNRNAISPPGIWGTGFVSCAMGVRKINSFAENFKLSQNYPNPFNPTTKIKFDIPKSSFVKMIVYNSLGKEVSILVNEKLSAGSYEVNWDGSIYPNGVYFYTLLSGDFKETKKMLLLK